MPRTMDEIVARSDELAKVFEEFEPGPDTPMQTTPLGELYRAVRARADVEQSIAQAVDAAHRSGSTWNVIGQMLGTSGEAARQRYGQRSSATPDPDGRRRTGRWTTRSATTGQITAAEARRAAAVESASRSMAAKSKGGATSVTSKKDTGRTGTTSKKDR